MSGTTAIEWTQATWNPTTGCTKVSQGCKHCYAERMAVRLHGRAGYPEGKPFTPTIHPERLEIPLRWKKPRFVFVDSMSDLFHEAFDAKYIAKVFAIMDIARQHTYQVLTKRPERAAQLLNDEDFQFHVGWFQSQAEREFGLPSVDPKDIGPWPLRNVWIGTSVEDQAAADTRIPHLLRCPAAVRFLSCEPLLGPVDLGRFLPPPGTTFRCSGCGAWTNKSRAVIEIMPCPECGRRHYWCGAFHGDDGKPPLHWVIAGGESGPGARPMHQDWARSLRDQCQAAGVPYFFKQWGNWLPADQDPDYATGTATVRASLAGDGKNRDAGLWTNRGKKAAGALLDGRLWREMPREVRP